MESTLPTLVLTMLQQQGGHIDHGLRATEKELEKTCEALGYPPFASVIEFEGAFGGLVIPDEPNQPSGDPIWIFGAHACLTRGAHTAPRGGKKVGKLVPVVYSPNDIIYFLDQEGRAFGQDSIEDTEAHLFAENGTALVCKIIFNNVMFARKETTLELQGLQADTWATRLGLFKMDAASDATNRYFADAKGDMVVLEDLKTKRTSFAATTQAQLARLKAPAEAAQPKVEWAQYLGKELVYMVGEQRSALPDIFEHLPEMRELDVSINRLTALPESLWRATQLTKLDLSFNPLTDLAGIGKLKGLRILSMRGCPFTVLPEAIADAKSLTHLNLTECESLDVDAALWVISQLPKLKEISLPLSHTLTSLAPLAKLPLKSIYLNGARVKHASRLPAGLGLLPKLTDLRIAYADDIALLPEAPEDIHALRFLFGKRFTDDDIKASAQKQPEKLYLQAFARTL